MKLGAVTRGVFTAFLALVVGAIVLELTGRDAVEVYRLLVEQSLLSPGALADTLLNATPLIFTGVATAIAFRAGVFNVGVEGSLYLGAFAAAWVGFTMTEWPPGLLIPAAFLAAGVIGALWAVLPGVARAYYGVDEVVSTLLLNYVATSFTGYLVSYPFLAPGAANAMSPLIAPGARLTRIAPPSQLNLSFVIALAVAVAAAVLIYRTTAGFALRAAGSNPRFAQSAGIDVRATIVMAMVVSGFIGGLGGAGQILGVNYRFIQGFSPGYGFDGITVALLVRNDPLGAILGALFFGALRNGGATIQLFADIPIDLIHVLQAAIILFVTVEPRVTGWFARWRQRPTKLSGTPLPVRE